MHLTGTPLLLLGNKVAYLYPRCAYDYSSKTCYTNLPSAGAMRGYGAPQVVFAVESMLDDAATALGIDPVEIVYATPPAKEMLIRSRENVFTAQGCRSVLKKAGKSLNGKNAVQSARTSKAIYVMALASPVLATPLTPPVGVEIAGARLLMNQDGTINVQKRRDGNRPGADTVFSQMVAETVGVPVSDVRVISTQDTDVTPFDPGAFASRQSYVAAPALRSAALLLKRKSSLTPQSCYISQR